MPATFTTNKIMVETEAIAAELRQAREAKNIPIQQAARQLGIQGQYLEALETGKLDILPAGLYRKNFLREYAQYLNLDHESLVQAYLGKAQINAPPRPTPLFVAQATAGKHPLPLSRVAKIAFVALLVLACFMYLGWYLNQLGSPPSLRIFAPTKNYITTASTLTVSGAAMPEATVMINGETVQCDQNGFFSQEIQLKNGVNAITISSQKKYGRKNIITRQILVKPK